MISRAEGGEGDPWRIVSCVLAVRNPLVIADDPGIWSPRWLTATLASFLDDGDRNAIRGYAENLDRARGRRLNEETEYTLSAWLDTLKSALARAGHDGIVYRNVFEAEGRGIEWSWLAFDDRQIVRLGDRDDIATLDPGAVETGTAPKLRGASPMRRHQARGIGEFARAGDRKAFRQAVAEWAAGAGISWDREYPIGYEPSWGEAYPRHDFEARIGGETGFDIRVTSSSGEVSLTPRSPGARSDALMERFASDASESFYDHGRPRHPDNRTYEESLAWRPAETVGAFVERLDRVYADFSAEFAPVKPEPRGRSMTA